MTLRGVTFRNRAWVAPMCQYSSVDGRPSDWHLVHLGGLARGGAGLVMQEATAVVPEGRISPADAGIWTDQQARDYRRIVDFIHGQGARAGIQLAHAGRKASTRVSWQDSGTVPEADGGWRTVAPSAQAFGALAAPRALSRDEVAALPGHFALAARRSIDAGFDVVEVHGAHGYLVHQFLSPLSNDRDDEYGGDLAGRARLLYEIAESVRAAIGGDAALFVRLSATDWVDGGWDLDSTIEVSKELTARGVDLIDVSSGGLDPRQEVVAGPSYQVPFARAVREGADATVSAVGLITEPAQAEGILADGSADAVMLGRALLRDPSWPLRAAFELGDDAPWPNQYQRGSWAAAG